MNLKQKINSIIFNTFPKIETDPALDSKKGFKKVVLISLIEFIFLLLLYPLSYEVSDDFIMNSIASGAISGEPSVFLIFTNVIIGGILKVFYSIIPNINWYTVYMLGSLFIGYTVIQYSFYKLRTTPALRIIRHMLVFTVLLNSLIISGFTRTATIVGIAGFLIIFLKQGKKYNELIYGTLLLILASLIRHHVFLMLVMLSAPIVLLMLLQKKYKKIIFLVAALVIGIFAQLFNSYMYKSNPEYAEYGQHRNISASLYKANKPGHTLAFRSENEEQAEDWTDLEMELEGFGLLHMNTDSLEKKDYRELLGVKRSVIEKTFNTIFFTELKNTYKTIWKYLDARYYFTVAILAIFVLFFGNRRRELFILVAYALYVFLIAFYLHYYFEGVLKSRVLVGMILSFIFVGLFMLDKNGDIPDNFLFFTGINKQTIGTLIISLATVTIFVTGFQYKKIASGTYNRRDRVHSYQKYLKTQSEDFYVRRFINNPYYIYKNPEDQTNAFRLGWLAYSPDNKKKLEKYAGNGDMSIYDIKNKDITWYFGPRLIRRDAVPVISFYKSKYENGFYTRNVINTKNHHRLYKYTFYNAVPDSSKYSVNDIDTALFNMADTTYQKLMNPEEELDNEKTD